MGYCIESTKSFFCNTDNHLAKFVRDSEGQDKLAKFMADGVFPLVSEVARITGASQQTLSNIETGHNAVKLTRDVTGMLNIFRGVIPGTVLRCKQVGALVDGLASGHDVDLRPSKKAKTYDPRSMVAVWRQGGLEVHQPVTWDSINPHGNPLPAHYTLETTGALKHNEVAVGTPEILLKLGENAGAMIGAATYAAGFGVSRPAANVRKYFDVEYGDTANRLADAFPYIMFANHIGGVVQHSFELAYQFKAYERGLLDVNFDRAQVENDCSEKVVTAVLSLLEKVLELLNDVFLFIRVAAPAWFKIPLGLGISGLGLVRVWRKTA